MTTVTTTKEETRLIRFMRALIAFAADKDREEETEQ